MRWGVDAPDDMDIDLSGFFVVPELPLGMITGVASCLTALGAVLTSKRKSRRSFGPG